MTVEFKSVVVSRIRKSGSLLPLYTATVTIITKRPGLIIKLTNADTGRDVFEFTVNERTECARFGALSYLFYIGSRNFSLMFREETDFKSFHSLVGDARNGKYNSAFMERTDNVSAEQYFQFYGLLSQQQNMLQDYVRTSTYQRAILSNNDDFYDKVVLDVGAGTGILSFFAAHAGAKRVYAVEASSIAENAEILVSANNLKDKIHILCGKIEEIDLPEMVDVIISEPLGYMLFNERMLETFLHAKKWLKPGGLILPTRADLHIAPFMDDMLYMEQANKAIFWAQKFFHGVDLSPLQETAMKEYFGQPIVDTFDIRICLAKSVQHRIDFNEATEADLHRIEIPLEFRLLESGTVHGLAVWFDVMFCGSTENVVLSTSPTEPLTHWYQVRCLLEKPIQVRTNQLLTGSILLQANDRQSYDVTLDLCVEGNEEMRSRNTVDLKNPVFRYSGYPLSTPPGYHNISPSEAYWTVLEAQRVQPAEVILNEVSAYEQDKMQTDTDQSHSHDSESDVSGIQS